MLATFLIVPSYDRSRGRTRSRTRNVGKVLRIGRLRSKLSKGILRHDTAGACANQFNLLFAEESEILMREN